MHLEHKYNITFAYFGILMTPNNFHSYLTFHLRPCLCVCDYMFGTETIQGRSHRTHSNIKISQILHRNEKSIITQPMICC